MLLPLVPPGAMRAADAPSLTLVAEPARVELATKSQKLLFTQSDGHFRLTTFVRDDREWRLLFDAGRPLLAGPMFDWQPDSYTIVTNTADRKVVEFSGRHLQPAYACVLRVEAASGNPLFRFLFTCHLPEPLILNAPQPAVALWRQRASPAFHLDQGPDSIYGAAGIPHGYGFPAAYLWDDGLEAAVFFNMTPMRWMQPGGVARFHDVRIMTRSDGGHTGLGMHFKKLSGPRVPAGEMVIEFFLHQNVRPARPAGLEALDTMVRAFASLHPADSVLPRNRVTGEPASWGQFARQAITDLSRPETMAELSAPWRDQPLELVAPQERMIVHPAQALADPAQSGLHWDFSTVNNHLTPWLLLARLHGDQQALRLGLQKKDALPRFYDPKSRLIRHGTRQPPHVGDLEMCWQNFFFHEETLRAAAAAGSGDFNPAVAGRFLMATAGLRDLARQVDYVFPQWFDPYEKQPVVQNDMKRLGLIREPWQAGAYARLLLHAFAITGEQEFLSEAQRAIEALMERMQFRVQNEVYDRTYADVAGFPVTELFGNAHGVAAAYRVYEETGNLKFLRYSRDFMNTLLRLTFWYEDETDPVSRELRNAGLFYPHGGAHVATPWETAEAHLMIAWTLKHDREHPLTDLLLKLSNLNRINSFYFFPAAWSETVRAVDQAPRKETGQYFPIEPFYCLEGAGHSGPTAAYMAGLALWNDWLYEALAEPSDRGVMVLNLDALEDYEAALTGVARHFIAYHPGPALHTCRIRFKHLTAADYLVTVDSRERMFRAEELSRGLPLTLRPGEPVRLTLRHPDHQRLRLQLEQQHSAQNALAHAYRQLQEFAVSRGAGAVTPEALRDFAQAWQAWREGRYAEARAAARQLVQATSE